MTSMPHTLTLAALPVVMALLHRLRGGGYVTLPVKGTYVLWPLVGLLAWLAGAPWPVAVAWAVGYLVWILPAWMAFLTALVGAPVPAGQVMGSGWDVRLVWALSLDNALLACLVRAGLFLVPLLGALLLLDAFDVAGPLYDTVPLALIVVTFPLAYLIGYRLRPTDMSSVAEPIVGAFWGAAMSWSIILETVK